MDLMLAVAGSSILDFLIQLPRERSRSCKSAHKRFSSASSSFFNSSGLYWSAYKSSICSHRPVESRARTSGMICLSPIVNLEVPAPTGSGPYCP